MALTGYEKLKRYREKQKDINEKARKLFENRMRLICQRDKIYYNGIFAYPVIQSFARRLKLKGPLLAILLVMDLYTPFRIKDAMMWGMYENNKSYYDKLKWLRAAGYVDSDREKWIIYYWLTVKGKETIQEFNRMYDIHVKQVLKSLHIKNEAARKVTRIKPARLYKPRSKPTKRKPKTDLKGGGPEDTD